MNIVTERGQLDLLQILLFSDICNEILIQIKGTASSRDDGTVVCWELTDPPQGCHDRVNSLLVARVEVVSQSVKIIGHVFSRCMSVPMQTPQLLRTAPVDNQSNLSKAKFCSPEIVLGDVSVELFDDPTGMDEGSLSVKPRLAEISSSLGTRGVVLPARLKVGAASEN